MFGLILSYTGHFLNMSFLFFSFPILCILHGRFSSILRLIPVSAVVVHVKVLMKRYLLILNRWLEVQKDCISIQQFMLKELLWQLILICIGINEMWKIWNQKSNCSIVRKFHYATCLHVISGKKSTLLIFRVNIYPFSRKFICINSILVNKNQRILFKFSRSTGTCQFAYHSK